MRILVADDDRLSRHRLASTLAGWGYEVALAEDGNDAWRVLQPEDRPPLAILDWMMPGKDGPALCRALRALPSSTPTWVILLTARARGKDVVEGLGAGANDYLTKPYDEAELKARLEVGVRVIGLQRELAERVRQVEQALSEVKQLSGLLPICCYCKRIRSDQDYWQQVEVYVARHTDAQFTHGVCPTCMDERVRPEMERWRRSRS